ncbi:MAG: exodeoxyribonuclease V subunit gamma [Gammaproteobacteria bacterium]
MLYLYQSNRLEHLAEALAEVLAEPLPPPLQAETVVVQNQAVAAWLKLQIAERLGVCANVRFPLPGRFLWELFRSGLDDLPEPNAFDPETLAWRIFGRLAELDDAPCWTPLREYLKDGDERSRYELAQRIAATFDRYSLYRPDWIRDWESRQGRHWQAALWRVLAGETPGHWLNVRERWLRLLAAGRLDPAHLPLRVSLFNLGSLSPAYLDTLARLAAVAEVHVLHLNPCREYWGELLPAGRGPEPPDGHALLASWGRPARDLLELLLNYDPQELERYEGSGGGTLLAQIQDEILELRERAPADDFKADGSIEVHACPGALREVEILHDRLLGLFDRSPNLAASDIVVLAPDPARYAPHIDAVFGAAPGRLAIPFHVADRGLRETHPLIQGVLEVLDLCTGRLEAERALDLLEEPAVQRRFGFVAADLPQLRRWLIESGIRWAADGVQRAQLGLPATEPHSWRDGLRRLLLGYALPESPPEPCLGVLPCGDSEGQSAELLGRFVEFAESLLGWRDALCGARTVAQWAALLLRLIDGLFDADSEPAAALPAIRRALQGMAEAASRAQLLARPVGFGIVRLALERSLDAPGPGAPGGGVTFAKLSHWRALPARVIALIGMHDGAYPRAEPAAGFDLMAREPRLGDRHRRQDDRYAFLDQLLAAREVFYLSYQGLDPRDGRAQPPSILVSEILNYLDRAYRGPQDRVPSRVLTLRHPLQGFSPNYFTMAQGDNAPGLFSYAAHYCTALQGAGGQAEGAVFFDAPLAEAGPEWRDLSLDELLRFYRNPCRYLLQQRLSMRLPGAEETLDTDEPFALAPLARHALQNTVLAERLRGRALPELIPALQQQVALPHGRIGEYCLRHEVLQAAETFYQQLKPLARADRLEPVAFDLALEGCSLSGTLSGLSAAGWMGYRLGRLSGNDALNLWLHHLVLQVLAPAGVEPRSLWVAADEVLVLAPVSGARERLAELLADYWEGLHQPLHYFPRASYAYARSLRQDRDAALRAAKREWLGNEQRAGEGEDVYYRLGLRGLTPLDEAFERCALRIYRPFLDSRESLP